jgi:4a-hydroxytetrahydrobiopterin dehydratase
MDELSQKKCIPCEVGGMPLSSERLEALKPRVPEWRAEENKSISREFKFKDFAENMAFVNKVAAISESEGHHPDMNIHDWNKLTITLSTHAIGGLSENDFIVAAKIDKL